MKRTVSALLLVLALFGCRLSDQLSDVLPESESPVDQVFDLSRSQSDPGADVGDVWNRLGDITLSPDSGVRVVFAANTGAWNLGAIGMSFRYNPNLIEVRLSSSTGQPLMHSSSYFNLATSNIVPVSAAVSEFRFAGYSTPGLPAGDDIGMFIIIIDAVAPGTASVDVEVDILSSTEYDGSNYVEIGNPLGIDFEVEVTE